MTKTKAKQIADHLNTHCDERPYDYRQIAQGKADEIRVGLYWADTAAPAPLYPSAEVWQINERGTWIKRIGTIAAGDDGKWRAGGA